MKHRWAEVKRRYRLGFTVKEIAKALRTDKALILLDVEDMITLGQIKRRKARLAGKR